MILLQLFLEYFKVGLFSVGGGLATLPFLYDLSDKTGWFTYGDLANMIAVAESTPGPIGVNVATYVGFEVASIPGGIIATLGLVTPSFLVILAIAYFLTNFRENPIVDAAFYGLRAASAAMVCASGLTVAAGSLMYLGAWEGFASIPAIFNWKGWILAAVVYVLTNKVDKTKGLHPIWFILASAVVGAVFGFM